VYDLGVIGRLAQMGERCSHIAEVTGSIPVSPTMFSTSSGTVRNFCRESV
jgi:hypothetical protein